MWRNFSSVCAALCAMACVRTQAQTTVDWVATSGSNFGTVTNWSSNPTAPGSGNILNFVNDGVTLPLLTMDTSGSVLGLVVQGDGETTGGSLSIDGSGLLTIGSSGIAVSGGPSVPGLLDITANVALSAAQTWSLNNSNILLTGSLCGSSTLTITATTAGTVTLTSGASSFSGQINVTGPGTILSLGASNAAGVGTISMGDGTFLKTPSNSGSVSIGNNIAIGSGITVSPGMCSNYTLAGIISDIETADSLIVAGPVTMTGDNTYSGGTTINCMATLQLGSGGTTGSIMGNVVDNGTLAFDRSNCFTLSGTICGTGGLDVVGGMLVLAGSNTYQGGTTIACMSTLQLGSGGTTGSITGNVTDSGTLAFDRSDCVTFCGSISGNGGVNILTGMVTLAGTNSYHGETNLSANTTLSDSADNSYSANSDVLLNMGATLNVNHNESIGNLNDTSCGSTVNLACMTALTVYNTARNTYYGYITGTGALIVNGTCSSDLILVGADDYAGGTTIGCMATLQLGNGQSTGSITGNVVDNGTLAFDRNNCFTLCGTICGTGGLDVMGGMLILAGSNTYSGGTTIACMSTLQLGNGGTTGSITGSVTDSGTLAFDRSDCVSFCGGISGNGGVNILTGMVTLGGSNTYRGQTNLSANTTLSDSADNSYSANSDVLLNMGATLNVNHNESIGNLNDTSCGSTVNLACMTALTVYNTSTNTYYGYITGSGALIVNGTCSSSLALVDADDYTGGTTIGCMATLQLGNGGTTGSITGNVVDSGTLSFDRSNCLTFCGTVCGTGGLDVIDGMVVLAGDNTYSGATTIACMTTLQLGNGGTTGSITSNVTDNGTLAFDRSDCITYNGNICGNGGVNILTGMVTLGGSNTYRGVTNLSSHTSLSDAADYAYSANSDVLLNMGATLNVNHNESIGNLNDTSCGSTVNLACMTGLTVYNTGSNTYYGYITGTGALIVNGTCSSSLTLVGTDDYSGGTTIGSMGTLQLGNGGTTGSITGNVVDYGTLAFDRSDCISFTGNICGSGGVKIMTGMVTLSGANTYSGGTSITSANVTVSSDNGLGNSWVDALGSTLTFTSGSPFISALQLINSTANFSSAGTPLISSLTMQNSVLNFTGGSSPKIDGLSDDLSGSTNAINLAAGSNLQFSLPSDPVYYGTINGAGTVDIEGSHAELDLFGANTYTGGTTIGSNMLAVAGSNSAFGTGSVTMSNISALGTTPGVTVTNTITTGTNTVAIGGFGTVAPAVPQTFTFQGGSVIAGGRGSIADFIGGSSSGPVVGTFTLGSSASVVFGGGGVLQFSIMNASGASGVDYSAINANGSVDITATPGSPFKIQLVGVDHTNLLTGTAFTFNSSQSYSWTLLSAGTLTMSGGFNPLAFAVDSSTYFSNATNGGQFSVTDPGNSLVLNFTPVPEPSTWMLMISGLCAAGAAVRRRRRR